jgi:hypothetical protein
VRTAIEKNGKKRSLEIWEEYKSGKEEEEEEEEEADGKTHQRGGKEGEKVREGFLIFFVCAMS